MHYSYESNTVFLRDMRLACIVGINAKERRKKTKMILNVAVWLNDMKSKDSDAIHDTYNYTEIYEKIRCLETETNYQLLETLADHIVQICFANPLAKKVSVCIEKPGIHRGVKSAGIEILAVRSTQQ